jgi:hypothetical protein
VCVLLLGLLLGLYFYRRAEHDALPKPPTPFHSPHHHHCRSHHSNGAGCAQSETRLFSDTKHC